MANVMDISIKQVTKVVKKPSDYLKLLENHTKIEEKSDGVKVQLYLKPDASSDKSVDENWIVSYKGNILTSGEFEHNSDEEAKQSVGSSQFKFIFDTLKNVNVDNLPKGYQFFCEYLINKPTLMSQYKDLYNLILLAYRKSNCKAKNGLMICDNTDFDYDYQEREKFASILGAHTPPLVFEGTLYPYDNLTKGIKYSELEKNIKSNEEELRNSEKDPMLYYKVLVNVFLSTESVFGGKPEGFVVYGYGENPLKFQQEYQLSKEERQKIKMQFRADSEVIEAGYWAKVKTLAEELVSKLELSKTHKGSLDLRKPLNRLSAMIKKLPENVIVHPKKNAPTVKDDVMLTAKQIIIRELANRFVLIPGKLRIFTKKHKELIDTALKKFDGVVINIVNNKGVSKELKKLKREVIENCYKDLIKAGKIEVQESQTGNLNTLINKTTNQIFGVYAGSDRVPEYQEYFKKARRNIEVLELPRDDSGISATKVIENINDKEYFKKNTPKCSWKFYEEYLKYYSK
jgi:phosphopantetheine adenylyltransferase